MFVIDLMILVMRRLKKGKKYINFDFLSLNCNLEFSYQILIPIDIHVNKLLDWLISCRIVDKNWHRNVKEVRNKINEAIKDMPANELIKLLSGDREWYFHYRS